MTPSEIVRRHMPLLDAIQAAKTQPAEPMPSEHEIASCGHWEIHHHEDRPRPGEAQRAIWCVARNQSRRAVLCRLVIADAIRVIRGRAPGSDWKADYFHDKASDAASQIPALAARWQRLIELAATLPPDPDGYTVASGRPPPPRKRR